MHLHSFITFDSFITFIVVVVVDTLLILIYSDCYIHFIPIWKFSFAFTFTYSVFCSFICWYSFHSCHVDTFSFVPSLSFISIRCCSIDAFRHCWPFLIRYILFIHSFSFYIHCWHSVYSFVICCCCHCYSFMTFLMLFIHSSIHLIYHYIYSLLHCSFYHSGYSLFLYVTNFIIVVHSFLWKFCWWCSIVILLLLFSFILPYHFRYTFIILIHSFIYILHYILPCCSISLHSTSGTFWLLRRFCIYIVVLCCCYICYSFTDSFIYIYIAICTFLISMLLLFHSFVDHFIRLLFCSFSHFSFICLSSFYITSHLFYIVIPHSIPDICYLHHLHSFIHLLPLHSSFVQWSFDTFTLIDTLLLLFVDTIVIYIHSTFVTSIVVTFDHSFHWLAYIVQFTTDDTFDHYLLFVLFWSFFILIPIPFWSIHYIVVIPFICWYSLIHIFIVIPFDWFGIRSLHSLHLLLPILYARCSYSGIHIHILHYSVYIHVVEHSHVLIHILIRSLYIYIVVVTFTFSRFRYTFLHSFIHLSFVVVHIYIRSYSHSLLFLIQVLRPSFTFLLLLPICSLHFIVIHSHLLIFLPVDDTFIWPYSLLLLLFVVDSFYSDPRYDIDCCCSHCYLHLFTRLPTRLPLTGTVYRFVSFLTFHLCHLTLSHVHVPPRYTALFSHVTLPLLRLLSIFVLMFFAFITLFRIRCLRSLGTIYVTFIHSISHFVLHSISGTHSTLLNLIWWRLFIPLVLLFLDIISFLLIHSFYSFIDDWYIHLSF